MKLCVNGFFGIQVTALAEILGVLNRAGISTGSAVSILNELPATSPALNGIGKLMAAGKFAPLFPVELIEKDFGYLEHLADLWHSEIPSIITARRVNQEAKKEGYGGENLTAVAKLYL